MNRLHQPLVHLLPCCFPFPATLHFPSCQVSMLGCLCFEKQRRWRCMLDPTTLHSHASTCSRGIHFLRGECQLLRCVAAHKAAAGRHAVPPAAGGLRLRRRLALVCLRHGL